MTVKTQPPLPVWTETLHCCPKCTKLLVLPKGLRTSPILVVGEFPSYADVMAGTVFTISDNRNYSPGDVLRLELLRVGIDIRQVRLTNLWLHQKDEKECDPDLHLENLVREFHGKTHVLLMGSELTLALLGEKYTTYSGLQVKVPAYPDIHFWVSPGPSGLLHGQPVGEFRLALKRFAEDFHKEKR